MGHTTHRTLQDRASAVQRMIRALARDTSEWDVEDLKIIGRLQAELIATRQVVVYGLRDHGANDREIGEALGITQQAVSKRWPGDRRYVGAAGRYRRSA